MEQSPGEVLDSKFQLELPPVPGPQSKLVLAEEPELVMGALLGLPTLGQRDLLCLSDVEESFPEVVAQGVLVIVAGNCFVELTLG
jgi:hypothetical protein